ncbi:MAG: hypothetical protein QM346_12290 [Chloroflexota bacterium]|nr:hypothetical protein [Chloroflexota bacterium]
MTRQATAAPAEMHAASAKPVTCRLEYVEARAMWRVAVYDRGAWLKDEWFHNESFARLYAQWREALG